MGDQCYVLADLDLVPIPQETGWAPGLVWTGAGIDSCTEVLIPTTQKNADSLRKVINVPQIIHSQTVIHLLSFMK